MSHWCKEESLKSPISPTPPAPSTFPPASFPSTLPVQLPLGPSGCPVEGRWTVSSSGFQFPWWHCLSERKTGGRRGWSRKENPYETRRIKSWNISELQLIKKESDCLSFCLTLFCSLLLPLNTLSPNCLVVLCHPVSNDFPYLQHLLVSLFYLPSLSLQALNAQARAFSARNTSPSLSFAFTSSPTLFSRFFPSLLAVWAQGCSAAAPAQTRERGRQRHALSKGRNG